ncbi:MAG: hypothetical protein K8J31_07405, partial [Anaerolineae bacterium]|nr:hypothetical protein [Anaerolineae bacterium]
MATIERDAGASASVPSLKSEPTYEILSQRQLIWRKFKRHRVAHFCLYVLIIL